MKIQSTLALRLAGFLSLLTVSHSFPVTPLTQTRRHLAAAPLALFPSNNDNDNNKKERLDKGFQVLEWASGVVPQGALVTGVSESWKFAWKRLMAELAPQDATGAYQRPSYTFSQGTIGSADFPDEPNRYHLYVGNPCPWCHRVVLVTKLFGWTASQLAVTRLQDEPRKASRGGWIFSDVQPDTVYGCQDLRQLYERLSPGFTGRCTAPVLVDTVQNKIVSNESSHLVRMLNQAALGQSDVDNRITLVPVDLQESIDETNEWVYRLLNNGVYQCGFCTTQQAYNVAAQGVLEGLQRADAVLQDKPFLSGNAFTEADLRLLPTILRFDGAYAPLFRAGGVHTRIANYPHLHAWLKRCWNMDGVSESIDLPDACGSYYKQLFPLNPSGIVPLAVTPASLGLLEE